MDKINSATPQALPIWERDKNSRGHRSSVDGALQAHRARVSERQQRTEERLAMVKSMHSQFFPKPQMMNPVMADEGLQTQTLIDQANLSALPVAEPQVFFEPRQIDNLLADGQLGSVADASLAVVEKEMAMPNPEEGPIDDMPKGSYIDYRV